MQVGLGLHMLLVYIQKYIMAQLWDWLPPLLHFDFCKVETPGAKALHGVFF